MQNIWPALKVDFRKQNMLGFFTMWTVATHNDQIKS